MKTNSPLPAARFEPPGPAFNVNWPLAFEPISTPPVVMVVVAPPPTSVTVCAAPLKRMLLVTVAVAVKVAMTSVFSPAPKALGVYRLAPLIVLRPTI